PMPIRSPDHVARVYPEPKALGNELRGRRAAIAARPPKKFSATADWSSAPIRATRVSWAGERPGDDSVRDLLSIESAIRWRVRLGGQVGALPKSRPLEPRDALRWLRSGLGSVGGVRQHAVAQINEPWSRVDLVCQQPRPACGVAWLQ